MVDHSPLSDAESALLRLLADADQPTKGQAKLARSLCDRGLALECNKSCTRITISKAGRWAVERGE